MDVRITVAIPTYNNERTIIRSIDSCIDQSTNSYDILIVNNSSTDGTQNIIEKYIDNPKITLSKTATVVYLITTFYVLELNAGILWNSFSFEWGIKNLIISERDLSFLLLGKNLS